MAKLNLNDVIAHDDFIIALCTFLDEFKRSDNRYDMISTPPNGATTCAKNLCMLAGTAHKLANDFGLNIPSWVNDPKYRMPYPVYAFDTQDKAFQEFLISDTPYEFASKNMFVGANAIERV